MLACAIIGIDCHWAVPKGYEPASDVVERATLLAKESGATMTQTHVPEEAVSGAHYVYTDAFVSMGEEHLEDKLGDFDGFQVNLNLLSNADSEWKFMHCLPAKRNQEVTASVIDGSQSVVWDEAENRLHSQKALLSALIHA